jgi:hypothetical protein
MIHVSHFWVYILSKWNQYNKDIPASNIYLDTIHSSYDIKINPPING